MFVFPRLLSTFTRLLEFRSPGRVTLDVRSPEDLSTDLFRFVLVALFRLLEVLRSEVAGRVDGLVELPGLEISLEADLL